MFGCHRLLSIFISLTAITLFPTASFTSSIKSSQSHSKIASFKHGDSDIEYENSILGLSKKVAIIANIPIFEFGKDITKLLMLIADENGAINPSAATDLELIFYDYMTKLRGYYYLMYQNLQMAALTDGLPVNKMKLEAERDHCVRECEKAMQTALPMNIATVSWNFQGPLLELTYDIDSSIEEALSNMVNADLPLGTNNKIISRRMIMLRKIWKRCRWFAVQAALLAFNIAQTEWNRRSSKHAAEKRLAEVPEFPLL